MRTACSGIFACARMLRQSQAILPPPITTASEKECLFVMTEGELLELQPIDFAVWVSGEFRQEAKGVGQHILRD